MARTVTEEEVRRLIRRGVQLVEVLEPHEYQREHLAGAINLPLSRLDREMAAQLDASRPIVVYCYDYQ